MTIKFLAQGYEVESKNAIGNYLIDFLSKKHFHSFTAISAFASEVAINGMASYIENAKKNFEDINIIVGIDQEGTSKEALYEIENLSVNAYIFYQKESPIFHPKIYLFEGDGETKIIIGSSNLTGRGLFINVESSLLVEFSKDDKEGETLLSELKEYYKGLFDFTDENLFEITKETIQAFIDDGIVPNEIVRRQLHGKHLKDDAKSLELNLKIPKRKIASIPKAFKTKIKAAAKSKILSRADIGEQLTLLWESGPLTERDLNIPKGSNTNPTGSMLFKKGKTEGIDQRHYFRDVVFSSLNWIFDTRTGSTHLEKAAALFRIIIDHKDYGSFALTLTHNPRTDTRSYEQKNSMTSISWGDAKPIIARDGLIGKSAKLYNSDNNEFSLIIE
jgi:HKD family nuclease